MAEKQLQNIHAGHRERLVELVYKCGLENLGDVQAMEFVLCYIFPRGDVNPLAHKLLDKYGSFSAVMESSVEDLQSVKGMGKVSAEKLHLFLEIFYKYTADKFSKREKLSTVGQIFDYLEALLRFKNDEELHILGISSSGKVVAQRCLSKGNSNMVGIEMRDISLFVSTAKVPAVILVHNHPGGTCCSSSQDRASYQKLIGLFGFSGCKLIDSLIVGEDGIFSMKDNVIKRMFITEEDYYYANEFERLSEFSSVKKIKQ